MKSTKITDWAQLITGLALLLGLLMVFYELRQAKQLAFAEIMSQGYSEVLEDARTIMGENPAVALAKACYQPDALTREERLIIDTYYSSQLAQISRLGLLNAVADFGVSEELVSGYYVNIILSTPYGQRWFAQRAKDTPRFADYAKGVDAQDCRSF